MNSIIHASGQIQGGRAYQQDTYAHKSFEKGTLFVLADGMGGYAGGEIASQIVVDTFIESFEVETDNIEDSFRLTLQKSNHAIETYKKNHEEVSSMGTTLITFYITKNSFHWISVGDSPLYIITEQSIKRINQNHSVAGLLDLQAKKGIISLLEAQNNPNRHLLTSAIMGEELTSIDFQEYRIKDSDNFQFLLASDGIETLSEQQIFNIVNKSSSIEIAKNNLLEKINKINKPKQDNATVILIGTSIKKPNQKNSSIISKFLNYLNKK